MSAVVQQKLLQQQWNQFLDAYQARKGAGGGAQLGSPTPMATQTNPMAVFGAPGQTMGTPQSQQQNPLMGMLRALGGGAKGIGRGLGGMFGQRPDALAGGTINQMFGRGQPTGGVNPLAAMMGGGQQGMAGPMAGGGIDPRMMLMLQRLLGGGYSGVPQGLLQ